MKEYDIFVPLYYNDGAPIEPQEFQRLQAELLETFEGLTFFPQPNEGFWKMSGITYRDEIVVYRVLTDRVRTAASVVFSQGAVEARTQARGNLDH